MLAQDLIP